MLYGCETLTLTLREELRIRKFENCIPRLNQGQKHKDGELRWRQSYKLQRLFRSPDVIRMINLDDHDGQGIQPEWKTVGVLQIF